MTIDSRRSTFNSRLPTRPTTPAPPAEGRVWADATISMVAANAIALLMFPFVAALIFVPYIMLWGGLDLRARFQDALGPLPIFLVVFFLAIVLHEALHGVGFALVGKIPWREIHFGIKWMTFTPYTHTAAAMPAASYRVAVALPGLLLGLVPSVLGVLLRIDELAVWGALLLGAAGGDMAILWAIRRVPGRTLVRDHPSKAGCQVLVA